MNPLDNRDKLKMVALLMSGLVAVWGMFVMGWCAMWKIYVDTPLLMALSNILSGIGGALTTILVGRNIAQLNQPDEPIQVAPAPGQKIPIEIKQPSDKPVPVVEKP